MGKKVKQTARLRSLAPEAQKPTTPEYRRGWERIFKWRKPEASRDTANEEKS